MELKSYLKIIKRYWVLAVLLPIVATLTAYYATSVQPPVYEGGISMIVSSVSTEIRENPPFYEFDGYYAIQSSQLFASTVADWLASPDVVVAIYDRAEVNLEAKDTDELRLKIKSQAQKSQIGSNTVDAILKGGSKEETEMLALSCADEIAKKTEQFNKINGTKNSYKVEALGGPVIIKIEPKIVLNSVIAFVTGLATALFLIFLVHYLRKQ